MPVNNLCGCQRSPGATVLPAACVHVILLCETDAIPAWPGDLAEEANGI